MSDRYDQSRLITKTTAIYGSGLLHMIDKMYRGDLLNEEDEANVEKVRSFFKDTYDLPLEDDDE